MEDLSAAKLKDADFYSIQKLVLENTGISLSSSKRELVKRRYNPRLKALGLPSYSSYIKYVKGNFDSEIANFCNAITTNLTSFFRENHHFEFLKDQGIPELLRKKASSKKLRLWSAGCSSGQEAYCLAMILRNSIPAFDSWDVKILATDLDEKCLDKAKNGAYAKDRFDKVPSDLISKYFTEEEQQLRYSKTTVLQAKSELKKMISFNKLNLMKPWPMKGKFDIIFCRNVFIYFDKGIQKELLQRYSKLQNEGAYLCLGHSETIADPGSLDYRLMGKTLYIKE